MKNNTQLFKQEGLGQLLKYNKHTSSPISKSLAKYF
jgi:hypothetical protein